MKKQKNSAVTRRLNWDMPQRKAEKKGERRGEEKGIKAMIATLKELNVDKKNTIDKIMAHFNLKLNVVKKYVETNW